MVYTHMSATLITTVTIIYAQISHVLSATVTIIHVNPIIEGLSCLCLHDRSHEKYIIITIITMLDMLTANLKTVSSVFMVVCSGVVVSNASIVDAISVVVSNISMVDDISIGSVCI